MLKIYNSLSGRKEEFVPIEAGRVGLYVCGMTVYDYCHLGHARVMVVFDAVVRYLRFLGFQVNYVRNITDIDDKIIRRAQERGEDFCALAKRFTEAMHEDARALGVLPPSLEPKATESIPEIIVLVRTLLDQGYAYVAANGDVYYDVSRFEQYGKLANKKLEDLRAGSRIEIDEAKDDPLDFVLWKAAKPAEPSWDSPWGPGRPGWHIECSAMSMRHLSDHFDIHGGGMDLKFPHHENEIAQSEAVTGHKFVNYWMHNGFVRVESEKMSKSLGNFFTVREVLESFQDREIGGEVIRLFILSSHYRSPLDYSEDNLESARTRLRRLYTALRGLPVVDASGDAGYQQRFKAAMDDDFNTPEALAVLDELVRQINRLREAHEAEAAHLGASLRHLSGILGLLQSEDPVEFLQKSGRRFSASVEDTVRFKDEAEGEVVSVAEIEAFVAQRSAARKAKNWAEADRIRELLKAKGIVLEDGPDGTIWRQA
jgi:cysteinyl-tRNA synthetase